MNYQELLKRAMGPDGLSANFTGKNNEKMEKILKFEDKTFGMVVKNGTDKDVTFALIKGSFPNLEEIKKKYNDVDAILADGDFFEDTVDGYTKKANCRVIGASSVAHLQEFFAHGYEGEISNLQMTSTEKGNFYDTVQIALPSPFETMPAKQLDLSQYLDPSQFDQNRILADNIGIPLTPLNVVLFRIRAHSEINYTFTINAWSRTRLG